MKKFFTEQDLNNIMNLGMTLRQNQLAGYTSESGNEVLAQYVKTHGTEINEELIKIFNEP